MTWRVRFAHIPKCGVLGRPLYMPVACKQLVCRKCLSSLPRVPVSPATRQGTRDTCMSLRILIVDDSASIRSMLRFFIEHNTDWQICGEAENGQVAVEKVAELKPQAVILGFSMPVVNGL